MVGPAHRRSAAGALAAAGAAWPALYGALSYAWSSPLERALSSAWCGSAPHGAASLLAHCAGCWSGAAAFFAAAALLAAVTRRTAA